MNKTPIGILGGGFAGLMAGYELQRRDISFVILEQEEEIGGLAKTVSFAGVKGEYGPHALYSKNPEVLDFFKSLPIEYITHKRKVRICHKGFDGKIYELDYPFENGLGDLPLEERVECLTGYINSFMKKRKKYKHMQDWIDNGLGAGIAKYFMVPYNNKIWNVSLNKISIESIMKKIDPAPVEELIKACLGIPTVGRIYQSIFLYPKKGTGEISKVVSQNFNDKINLVNKIKKIEFTKKGTKIETTQGNYLFDKVISTIPIPEMLNKQNLKSLKPLAKKFKTNNTYFVAVVLKKNKQFKRFADCHWVFFAGDEIFYRINVMQAYVPEITPSLVAEITLKGEVRKKTIQQIETEVVKGLISSGMIDSEKDVESVSTKFIPYTYPIPTVGIEKIKKTIQKKLEKYNFYLLGRNGNWDYINMDQIVVSTWRLFAKLEKEKIIKSIAKN